jgi:hypothetical protein
MSEKSNFLIFISRLPKIKEPGLIILKSEDQAGRVCQLLLDEGFKQFIPGLETLFKLGEPHQLFTVVTNEFSPALRAILTQYATGQIQINQGLGSAVVNVTPKNSAFVLLITESSLATLSQATPGLLSLVGPTLRYDE